MARSPELRIEGDRGEGGGQILRTSLTLAAATGRPFRIERIRGGRPRPGLMGQHLTAVRAAGELCGAEMEGAEPGSLNLRFRPGPVRPGAFRFAVGGAGSACLVLQTVLPAVLAASAPSRFRVEGGTHNPMAPPFDFLERVYLPALGRMGPRFGARLERHGFEAGGGGRLMVEVEPSTELASLELVEAGGIRSHSARSLLSRLPDHVGEREIGVVRERLGWSSGECRVERVDASGPGNVLLLEVGRDPVPEVVAGFGRRGVPAERVAHRAADELEAYLEADVPVGRHLADQLLLPMALGRGGSFRTGSLTPHARTNMEVIRAFGVADFRVREEGEAVTVEVVPG